MRSGVALRSRARAVETSPDHRVQQSYPMLEDGKEQRRKPFACQTDRFRTAPLGAKDQATPCDIDYRHRIYSSVLRRLFISGDQKNL